MFHCKHIMRRNLIKILVIVTILLSGCQQKNAAREWKESDGLIPDSTTAVKIAEIIWLNVYGENVLDTKPYKAKLIDNKVWIVEGTLNKGADYDGGTPYLEIQKDNCKVIGISHSK